MCLTFLYFAVVILLKVHIFQTNTVSAEFENSWIMYLEQPCCGGSGNHHVRHHRDHVREFTCGKLYYRTFYLDSQRDSLYVGAMDRVYRLNLSNINQSSCERDALILEPSHVVNCVSKGKSEPSVSRCVDEIVEVLNRDEIFQRFVKFPANIDQLNQLRAEFYRRYNFSGVIGCIDCTHVAIYPPKIHDEEHPENIYVNRKNYHSINVQLICDYNLKILNVNALFPGSTNDAFIWNSSNVQTMMRRLHEGGNTNYYLLGDSGYPLRTWLMTPLENEPVEGTQEYLYNKKHKTIRSLIERCNGVLKMRFLCLLKHRVLHYAPEKASKIINACVVLHNLCIQHNVLEPDDYDDIAQDDLGIFDPLINNGNNEDNFQRINPELAAGRRLRSTIIHNLHKD